MSRRRGCFEQALHVFAARLALRAGFASGESKAPLRLGNVRFSADISILNAGGDFVVRSGSSVMVRNIDRFGNMGAGPCEPTDAADLQTTCPTQARGGCPTLGGRQHGFCPWAVGVVFRERGPREHEA